MKKIFLSTVLGIMFCVAANASDGGFYTETETYTNNVSFNIETVSYYDAPVVRTTTPCKARVASSADLGRPCRAAAPAMEPVRVKTYTEVIDHYQVYQPVVKYVPAGTYSTRRVIENAQPCNKCNG